MAQNYKFFFDKSGTPCARGPAAEKPLMTFLELDVQGSDHICRVLMDDLTAVEEASDDSREFIGNAHRIILTPDGVTITENQTAQTTPPSDTSSDNSLTTQTTFLENDSPALSRPPFVLGLKRFREVLEDWEAFILNDEIDDTLSEDDYL